ncbi:hypothetical protein GCM10023219_20680 [Stakelama sediminis]|uniref:Uncharacterized protein n=1 Tax=Stakelama sediminis TaxID=463200 RepID=A0A840Z1Z4_9SPHN|nr:DUF6771 family protein [Stakelama sediminis]MBB5719935.1 hypothetical protein [Stakelama sediminis]
MTDSLSRTVTEAISRAPAWIRSDLQAKDILVRIRAEESLAARIVDAILKARGAEATIADDDQN